MSNDYSRFPDATRKRLIAIVKANVAELKALRADLKFLIEAKSRENLMAGRTTTDDYYNVFTTLIYKSCYVMLC